MKAPEERLDELKAGLVHLEDTIENLSERIATQRVSLDSVGLRLKALIDNLDAAVPVSTIKSHEKPLLIYPHRHETVSDGIETVSEGIACEVPKSVLSNWKRKWPIKRTRSSN